MNAAEVEMAPAHAEGCPGLEYCHYEECTLPVAERPDARVQGAREQGVVGLDPWIWPEEFAALDGVKLATIKHHTGIAKRGLRGPGEFPKPGRYRWRHVVTRSGGGKRVRSPQWRLSVIRAYQAAKRGPGGRPVKT